MLATTWHIVMSPRRRDDSLKNAKNENNNNRRMFCGLVVGNQIVHIGTSCSSPGARLKGGSACSHQSLTRHAEMDALRYLRNHKVRKARLVVGRLLDEGSYGNSRPCLHCIRRIVRFHPNVTHVTFYDGNAWITQTPETCSLFSKLSSADERHLCC